MEFSTKLARVMKVLSVYVYGSFPIVARFALMLLTMTLFLSSLLFIFFALILLEHEAGGLSLKVHEIVLFLRRITE